MYAKILEKAHSPSLTESKHYNKMNKVLKLLMSEGNGYTQEDVSTTLKISMPTVIRLMNEMVEKKLIHITGKKETDNGRRPFLYTLNQNHFYSVGVEILLKRLSITIIDIQFKEVYSFDDKDFRLENTPESLDRVVDFIRKHLKSSGIKKESMVGIGVSLTGRVSSMTGESYSFFNFMDQPLAYFLEEKLGSRVFVDNDSHALAQAEMVAGKARNVKNALVVNLSRGLGATLIVNKQIVTGGMGFAGEFGHMQFNTSDKLCLCGKRGCLGTTVSGYGLEEAFKVKMAQGEKSILAYDPKSENLRYDDILSAALAGDALSIALVQDIGVNLGKALGNIINFINPEMIVLSGKFSRLGNLLLNSVKTGMTMTALTNVLDMCQTEVSGYDRDAGVMGSAMMVYKCFNLI